MHLISVQKNRRLINKKVLKTYFVRTLLIVQYPEWSLTNKNFAGARYVILTEMAPSVEDFLQRAGNI